MSPEAATCVDAADLQTLARLIPATTRLLLPASKEDDMAKADVAEVPSASVRRGDIVRVLPGERMPVDGIVLEGECSMDESALTGESNLIPKQAGAKVRCVVPPWAFTLPVRQSCSCCYTKAQAPGTVSEPPTCAQAGVNIKGRLCSKLHAKHAAIAVTDGRA